MEHEWKQYKGILLIYSSNQKFNTTNTYIGVANGGGKKENLGILKQNQLKTTLKVLF